MSASLRTDVVIVTAAVSAGVHAALAPVHFEEGTAAGLGFAAAAVLLGGLVVTLTLRPTSAVALGAGAAVFAGLLVSYALAVTTGMPLLQPEPEAVDGLALVTKLVEAIGLVAGAWTFRRPTLALFPNAKGTRLT